MKTLDTVSINLAFKSAVNWCNVMPKAASGKEDVAHIIGKSLRTVESYLSGANTRMPLADDLMKLSIHCTRQLAVIPRSSLMPFTVYDSTGNIVTTANGASAASFLADIDGGWFQPEPKVFLFNPKLSETDELKSTLRKLLFSGAVTRKQGCEWLDCDDYMLVMYQSIWPFPKMPAPDPGDLADLVHHVNTTCRNAA